MVEGLVAILSWLLSWFKPRKSPDAIEGFDRLSRSQRELYEQVLLELKEYRKRQDATDVRLDECDRDRAVLRNDVSQLESRVKVCEDDRENLHKQLSRHSVELKEAIGITDEPKPAHRTTRKHFPDRDQQDAQNE